jgi:hypothetical protein
MVNDIAWDIIKKTSSFKRSRNGVNLNAGPYNVTGKGNKLSSGISNNQAVDVQLTADNKIVLVQRVARKAGRSIKIGYSKYVISKNKDKGVNAIRGVTKKGLKYRSDLSKAAVRKYYRLIQVSIRTQKAAAVAAAAPKPATTTA